MNISKLKAGKNVPEEVNVLIEIPQGSSVKYELDHKTGIIVVDRFSYSAFVYPFNYGFIPETQAQDGDPVDVLVISTYPVYPGTLISARPVGMLEMEDEAGVDEKIIAVPTSKIDPFLSEIGEIEDINETVRAKIKHMFEHYKELEPGKWVKIKNYLSRETAYKIIQKAME